ncbi:MAG TPA: carboxypeptidase-like regulatory domain-containing protein, partial [Thermoanaerobaculia bacterium]|nr:carboxypeptidase-like regulatory domain-containing protein [Thermoanaerobaculia bacterium]
MRGSTRILALIVLALTAGAGALVAQSTVSGSLQGRISDAEGNALPGVTITISSDALIAREMTTTSDERGAYRFPSLPVGVYAVTASLDGFQTARQDGIRIRLASTLAVDLALQLATVTEVIEVTASAPIVSVVNNTVSTSFDAQYLETQPIQRNYYQIIKAAPGVNADYTSSSGSAMLAYGGTSESQNAFTLDGVNVADAGAGQHWILPSIQWM